MWTQYNFEMDFHQQKNLIRTLKPTIERFENDGQIDGFNFNHYYSNPPSPDHLAVRLNFPSLEAKKNVEEKMKSMGLIGKPQDYTENEEIKKAYELGSRWASLFFNLAEKGKVNEELLKNREFLIHAVHGLFNSLGIPTISNERDIHYSLYYRISKETLSKKIDLDLKTYIKELNRGDPQLVYQRMIDLSQRLCAEKLNKEFPRADVEGRILPFPLENLMWASALIASAWLGWIFKSKAIWHYGKPHPEEEAILRNYLIPSVIDAFEQGVAKATADRTKRRKSV